MTADSDGSFENITIESAEAMENSVEFAIWISKNYEHVLSRTEEFMPGLCKQLSRCLYICYAKIDSREMVKRDMIRACLLISRKGLNCIYRNCPDGASPGVGITDLLSELYYLNAFALSKIGRPFLALEMLDYAENAMKMSMGMDSPEDQPISEFNYELCRLEETIIWIEFFDDLDQGMKKDMARCILSYLLTSADNFGHMGRMDLADRSMAIFGRFVEGHDILRFLDPDSSDIEPRDADDTIYEEWCWDRHLLLNPMNEVPNINSDWLKDDYIKDKDPELSARLADILSTYDHCRRLMHRYNIMPLEERIQKKRDEDVESLIDCYFRLYSILDKASKVIEILFPIGLDKVTFRKVASYLRHSPNKYLRGIYEVYSDMTFSDDFIEKGYLDPFYAIHGVKKRPGAIRNTLTHSAVLVVAPDEEFRIHDNTVTMRPIDLEIEVVKLMGQIREVLMNLKLAVEYDIRKKERGGGVICTYT